MAAMKPAILGNGGCEGHTPPMHAFSLGSATNFSPPTTHCCQKAVGAGGRFAAEREIFGIVYGLAECRCPRSVA